MMSLQPITICFTYFRSLTLANLEAALYSVSRQDLTHVESIVIVDNNTEDTLLDILGVVEKMKFTVPVQLVSEKHGDVTREQAWSTNFTVRHAYTPWVFYTRADYLLDFGILQKFFDVLAGKPIGWDGFVVSNGCHLHVNVQECEQTSWRANGPRIFHGVDYDYTEIDSGVWMARRRTYDRVGGFDEKLSAWGHAQTEFQYRMHEAGVEFVRLRETLFYHPQHAGARDMDRAHQQLRDRGLDIRKLWERYEGAKIY